MMASRNLSRSAHRARWQAATILLVSTVVACLLAGLTPHTAEASTRWATPSMRTVNQHDLIPIHILRRGAHSGINRQQLLNGLVALEQHRHETLGTPLRLEDTVARRALPDAPRGSLRAKAMQLGWMRPIGGRFRAGAWVTADEASRAMVGVLGLEADARTFAQGLNRAMPRLRTDRYTLAAHVFTRRLSMRYNHLTGTEHLEVQRNAPMRIGHITYMFDKAIDANEWRIEWAVAPFRDFSMPPIGPNQERITTFATRRIGSPYVWAGQHERNLRSQPQGVGGFDCSGLIWRTVHGAGVPPRLRVMNERTSMTQSAIPARQRIRHIGQLRPGDLVFFGHRGRRSHPRQNFHAGIALGNGWMVHSSGGNGGVTIDPIDGYWREHFSWGRRVLRRR